MTAHKQKVSIADEAYLFAQGLFENGDHPDISAAIAGELAVAKRVRAEESAALEAELQRRLHTPFNDWVRVNKIEDVTAGAGSFLKTLTLPG